MSARSQDNRSTLDARPPVDSEMKRTEIDEVAEVKVTFNTRVRNRLEQLLGSDMLRLNDRQYMHTLMKRIYEDQEHSLQQRAETRQMEENKRLKGLVEDMKMEKPPDMVESAFVVSFKKTKAEMEKVQRKQFNKRHNIKKRKTVSCAELDSDDETSPDVDDLTTNEVFHHSSFIGSTLDLSPEEDDSLAEEERQRELAQLAIKFGKYKEPLVQLLLQEGTVPRLYDLAEIILVKPPKPQKKTVVQKEEKAADPVLDLLATDSAEEYTSTEEAEEDNEEDAEGAEEDAEGAEAEAGAEAAATDGTAAEATDGTADDTAAEATAPADGAAADGETPAGDLAAEADTTEGGDTTEGPPDTSEAEGGDTTEGPADTSEAEDAVTAPEDDAESVTPLDESAPAAADEVAPSEGDTAAEQGGAAGAEESAPEEDGGAAEETAEPAEEASESPPAEAGESPESAESDAAEPAEAEAE